MKRILALVILLAFVLPNSGCKKGEGDPFLSFRTRKARIAGNWTLKSYKETSVNYNKTTNVTNTTVLTYDGTTMTKGITSTIGGGTNTVTYTYSETYVFDKDGTFTRTTIDNEYSSKTTNYEGQWNFTSKVGKDRKNKDQILTFITKATSGSYTETFSGPDWVNTSEFDIYQLKNKEIILKRITSSEDASFRDNMDAEWTYEVGK